MVKIVSKKKIKNIVDTLVVFYVLHEFSLLAIYEY